MHRFLLVCIGISALACGLRPSAPASAKKPAPPEPGHITLTAEAETGLGILEGLAKVTRHRLPERRLYPGEIMPAPGRAVLLTAPLPGTVTEVDPAGLPAAGTRVRAGQPLVELAPLPVLGERAQVATVLSDTEAQVARARAQEQAAALALARAERLTREGLAGEKLLEEARTQNESARAARRAAESQQSALLGASSRPSGSSARSGLLAATRIDAPFDGFIRDVRVAPHQRVVAGTPLIEVVSRAVLWVRVPVASTEIFAVAAEQDALVGELSLGTSTLSIAAAPVLPSPETMQPGTSAVDLYFLLPEPARFRVGQRVAAWLAQVASVPGVPGVSESLAVPAAALLYGPSGESWVYERMSPQNYVHRRVEVLRSEGSLLVLRAAASLAVGADVVTAGAAELHGVELGVGK